MKKQLELLEEIQEIDRKCDEIQKRIDGFPLEIEKIEKELSREEENLNGIKEALENLEKEKREKDGELSLNLEKLNRFRERVSSIKTNTEYQANMREIDQAKKLNKALEEEILTMMEDMEKESLKLTEAENALNDRKENAEKDKTEISQKKEAAERELGEIAKTRDEKLKAVDPGAAKLYENLRARLKGMVLAAADNGTCTGCYMQIPPQLINEAMKFDRLYQCPSCQRIIIIKV